MSDERLRNHLGETVDQTQPVPVVAAEGLQLSSKSPTLTYTGKAAAGAVSSAMVGWAPIYGLDGRVGSYWGLEKNKVYEAYVDGSPYNVKQQRAGETPALFQAVTETASSADITIYDPNLDLEAMFEGLTTTVKRFVAKVTDTAGNSLYGWIFGVAGSSNVYTLDVVNNRLTETQSWVGALAGFDNTSLQKIEIFRYNSSISFGTGTCFTEEVACPREFSKNRRAQIDYAERSLSNGQYFVDYARGEITGKRADTTASETVTLNILAGASGAAAVDGSSFTLSTTEVFPAGYVYDDDATISDGQVGAARMTSDRKQIMAGYDAPSDANKVYEVASGRYRTIYTQDVTNETNATTHRYLDVSNFDHIMIQLDNVAGTDTTTLTVNGSGEHNGTPAANADFQDITQFSFSKVSGNGTEAASYTADATLSMIPGVTYKWIDVQTVTAGGNNDADYTIHVWGLEK